MGGAVLGGALLMIGWEAGEGVAGASLLITGRAADAEVGQGENEDEDVDEDERVGGVLKETMYSPMCFSP